MEEPRAGVAVWRRRIGDVVPKQDLAGFVCNFNGAEWRRVRKEFLHEAGCLKVPKGFFVNVSCTRNRIDLRLTLEHDDAHAKLSEQVGQYDSGRTAAKYRDIKLVIRHQSISDPRESA